MTSSHQSGNAVAEREAEAGRLAAVKTTVTSALGDAKEKAADGYQAARTSVSDAYEIARDRAGAAYANAREAASTAGEKAAAGVQENPLGVLVGGIALGAVIGALLPRTEREITALAPLGAKLRDAATTAGGSAKKQAVGKLAELGISESLIDKAKEFVGQTESASGAKSGDQS